MPYVEAETWSFNDFFDQLPIVEDHIKSHPAIVAGRNILSQAQIGNHAFFAFACKNRRALEIWAMQESVITNHFSQILFYLLSQVRNVHLRAVLMPVAAGEHSPVRNGIAYNAHPHLLSKLCKDLNIDVSTIVPLPFTLAFAQLLTDCTKSLLYAFGVLGIGNEALLVPEYTAVERAFSCHYPSEVYRRFLRANIEEDKSHANLFEIAATCIMKSEADQQSYIQGARDGVSTRISYYDFLLEYCLSEHHRKA